ncbi:hypothetical protein EUTSA_v10006678mg [Eutrema salsugineum]|uniref:Uncharacterized protein n=1 Tax=Eutrema salsugineum TaxID=72664 RepID=V4L6N0_EUTSA|nr:uncharacterized protein LOC18993482 [Eutrema salsugineum]ESQ35428.1 hypothetical protein EUTSA_v10006678mg [Eutrema salsugineum]
MGTKVHCESVYHSMRDLNNESNGCRWPLFYGDSKTSANDQSYNGFPSQTTFEYDKDVVRRTMLEHEAVFKTQVLELHRVYRIQKDMMDELKRKQMNKEWGQFEASCSSQATNDDFRRWKIPSLPLANSVYDRPSMSVVEDNGHSPMKGSNSQGVAGPVPWQNGASSKNAEMLEVRPTKIRKKMIDLCLPADEYIDDNEEVVELKDHRDCGTSSQLPNGDVVKTEPRGDSLRVGCGFSSRSNGLADLNEPFKAQETNEFAYGHLRNGEFQGHIRDYGKALNSSSVREHVPVLHPDENGKSKLWPHQPLRIDQYSERNTHKSATPFLQPAKPLDLSSQPMQVFMNSSQRVMGLPNSGPQSKAVFWRERTFIDLEADTTDTNSSHEVIHESSLASHQPRHLYPYNPPDSAVPWNQLHSSWQNPSFGFPQRVASAQRYPVLNLSDTLSGSAQKQGCLGDRLQIENSSRYNSGSGNTTRSNHNMFYNECSSSSKSKFSGTGYNYPNGGRSDYTPANPFIDSNGSEVKFVRDLNLNVTFSNTSVVEVRKDEEHHATLSWLIKPKSACNSEVADGKWNLKSNDAVPSSSSKPSDNKEEAGKNVQNLLWLESLRSGSCSKKPVTEKINANLKIPGFAYREQSDAERDKVHKVRMLDINEPCEPLSDEDQQMEEQTRTNFPGSSNRCQIDLNMLVSEDECENWSVPTSSRLNSKAPMIDLEAPAAPESDDEEEDDISGIKPSGETTIEEKTLENPPEFEKLAAETIVAISSACLDRELEVVEAPETVILHWFAETVDTHRENLDQKLASFSRNQARSIEEIDYFESMTLQLHEITEDEYMPKPLVPEDLRLEETCGTAMVTSQRPRRGNARKGKQRRDFQRDILPGLLSLSKHEVTEDIQMFDGFMRATGSSWTPTGLARKKTGSRGRPRRVITIPEPVYFPVPAPCPSVEQYVGNQSSKNGEVEMVLEDRSFAGWGKMTRRPRRQRCPSTSTAAASNQRPSSSHAPYT